MEKKENKEAYVKTLKLALATSIIRSKPPDVSAKEYTRQLVSGLRKKEMAWKSKVTALEATLKQKENEITLLKLKNESYKFSNEAEEDNEGEEHSTDLLVTTNSRHGDKFLRAVISFNKWYKIVLNDEMAFENLKTNFIKSLEDTNVCLNSMPTNHHNINILEKNLQPLTELLKKEKFSSDSRVYTCCVEIVKNLISMLMTNIQFENSLLERLESSLHSLSLSCATIRDVVMENLVLVVSEYTKVLRDLHDVTMLDTQKYENMFFVCHTLHEVVMTTCSIWRCEKLDSYSKKLDDNLLETAEMFPMYCHTVWTISSMMTDVYCHQQEDVTLPLWKRQVTAINTSNDNFLIR